MTYKAVVDLIATKLPPTDQIRVFTRAMERYGTVAYSVDDAFEIVENGNESSYIRVWHLNLFLPDDQKRIMESGHELEFFALRGQTPYVWDIAWDLPHKPEYKIRDVSAIKTLTIHHTVGWDYSATNFENAHNIASYHVGVRQWPGIGYHFLIAPDGEIMQTNNLETVSYHAGSASSPGDENFWSAGICFAGDFRNGRVPTEAQLSVGSSLVQALRLELPSHINLIPHQRMPGAVTACPGDFPDEWLKILDGYEL